jgi:hypoxanthine phosphoribosyltransferase
MSKITYQDIKRDAQKLAKQIPLKYDAIFGIPSGGIAVAIYIEEMINTGNLLSLEEYQNYKDKSKVLVVDDLIDSGKTLEKYKESDIAILYKKPHSPEIAKYYLKDIGSEWLTFPHEKDSTGILDHLIRVFSFIDIRLTDLQQEELIKILLKIKEK